MSTLFHTTSFPGLKYALVSGEVKEGSDRAPKTMIKFVVDGFTEEVKNKGIKSIQDVVLDKRGFTKIAEYLEVDETKLEDISYSKLSRIVEKSFPGLGAHLSGSVPDMVEPLRLFVEAGNTAIKENARVSESMADPDRAVKNNFLNMDTYEILKGIEDPASATAMDYARQIQELTVLMNKAQSVSNSEYLSLMEEKFKANGLDKDGYVRLKAEKGTKEKVETK